MLSNVTPDIQIKMSKKVLLKIKELPRRSLVFIPPSVFFYEYVSSLLIHQWMNGN